MRKVILVGGIFLLLSLLILGCTAPLPETSVEPSIEPPAMQTEQQILAEHPDNLDQALEELEIVEGK